ncbi:MAG: alpha/beta hydrolase [Synechococcales cyanobacterium]
MVNAVQGTWQHGYALSNGLHLHYVTQGEGDLVILLHGFPEFWYSWRHQIPALAQKFRVVVPDLRGYNDSDKPSSGYDLDTLVADVQGLLQHFGTTTAAVVAHDWGGTIAWYWAERFPEQVRQLVVLNSPHPACWRRELLSNWDQWRRSWYMLFFQLPWLPEWLLERNLGEWVQRLFQETAIRKGAFSRLDVQHYQRALAKPGVMQAALNYYREWIHPRHWQRWITEPLRQIEIPTMVIWGEDDFALSPRLVEGLDDYCRDELRVEVIPECGHWIQQEAPQTVNRLLVEFLRPT